MLAKLGSCLKWFTRSKSLQMSVWFGLGGLAFSIGNLALAAALPAEGFGRLALFQAILGLGAGLAPFGLDNLVVRRELPVAGVTIAWVAVTGSMAGVASAFLSGFAFGFGVSALILMFVAVLTAAITRISAARQQAAVRLQQAQFLTQLPFVWFGLGAPVFLPLGVSDWLAGAALLASGYVAAATVGLICLRFENASQVVRSSGTIWKKSLSFVGILASVLVLHQLDRLVIGGFLSLEELATFAVVSTVVASPFRILHGGIGYSLMPRLRAETGTPGRLRLIRGELAIAAVLGIAGAMTLLLLARPIIGLLYGEKYPVTLALVIALATVGVVRLFYAVAAATVSALGDGTTLRKFNRLGWLAAGTAAIAAITATGFGLVAVVAAVGLGWVGRLIAAVALSVPSLRPTC